MSSKAWLSACLYYNEPWESFLSQAVKPFVDKMVEEKLIEQCFFIRYWERGSHIRLRFKGNERTLQQEVKLRVTAYFEKYFQKYTSANIKTHGMDHLPEAQRSYPNNSVQYAPYEPEVERYGGPFAIETAEKQFQASSDAVLAIISESNTWDYERALGSAIQLHLGFAWACKMTRDEIKFFYNFIFQCWFKSAYNYQEGVSSQELERRAKITLDAFEKNFNNQKDFLVSFQQTLWNALEEKIEFEQDWMNCWITDIENVYSELSNLQKQDKFIMPSYFKYTSEMPVSKEQYERMCIYESYIHMTNNRLGVLNKDEAFLGYLIKRSIEAL